MVSTRLIQLVAVFLSAASAAAVPAVRFSSLGPRIPSHSKHMEVLAARRDVVDTSFVAETTCLDLQQEIRAQDENIAQLSICTSLAGANVECSGSPKTTEGEYRTARFTVSTVEEFATINITKDRWMQCIQAARDACPTGSMSAVCVGGASTGDVAFTLANPSAGEL